MMRDARESGIRRLAEALAERKRAGGRYDAALGTSYQRMATRQAWLRLADKGLTGKPPGSTSAR